MKFQRLFLFALLLSASFNVIAQEVKWTLVTPGVWKAVVGKPEAYNLLTASGAKPNTTGLAKIGAASFPFHKLILQVLLEMVKLLCVFLRRKKSRYMAWG